MKSLITIWILAILSLCGIVVIVNYLTAPAGAVTCSGPCSAQSCPIGEYQQGIDRTTGETVCGQVTGCPYGDAIPMSDCDRYAPQDPAPQVLADQTPPQPPAPQPTVYYYYGGK